MARRPEFKINPHGIGKKACLKSLKRYCREIWSEFVKERDGRHCIICGQTKYLNAHHLITAKCSYTRYKVECGVSLCPTHHMLGTISAHCTPWVLYEWLEKNRPEQYTWFIENRSKVYESATPLELEDYREILRNLLNSFETHFPQILKRSKYFKFTSEEEEIIIADYCNDQKASLVSIATKYKCGEQTIKGILKRYKVPIRTNPGKHAILKEARCLRSSNR